MGEFARVAAHAAAALVVATCFGADDPARIAGSLAAFAAFATSAALSSGATACTAAASLAAFAAGAAVAAGAFGSAEASSECCSFSADIGKSFRSKFWQLVLGSARGHLNHLWSREVEVRGIVLDG